MPLPCYPFTAIVGQEPLKLALILAAIDPGIGGVLIQGPRGTAKSTMARALAELLPQGRLVTLPLGATEERLVGTLSLEKVLRRAEVDFSPGLLQAADQGVLYVDEVNLLPDHLVDLLLDVSASGVNIVERDGISHQHPARFVLIGTMNPDEGELRPQLLDRFGLAVSLDAAPEPDERIEIVKRRLAFDADPAGFRRGLESRQRAMITRCQHSRSRLAQIPLNAEIHELVASLCHQANVEGVRADLVMLRAARAHAAWQERPDMVAEDVHAVADLALHHRRKAVSESAAQSDGGASGESPTRGHHATGSWGELPPRPVPSGPLREVGPLIKKKC